MNIATNGIVINEYGEVLLIQRNDTRTMAPPGGSLESNELPTESVIREVREETGLIVQPVRLVGLHFWPVNPGGVLTLVFRCAQRGGELEPSEESLSVGFFPIASLPRPMISFHRDRVESAMAHSGGPVIWETQKTTWRLRLARLAIQKLLYRYFDLKRKLRGEQPFQPPPDWRISARLVIRNEREEVLWRRDSAEGWGLPGGRALRREPPWETASRVAVVEMGRAVRLTDLTGVYLKSGEERLTFVFAAQLINRDLKESRQAVEIRYCAPGEEPRSASRDDVEQATDACAPSPETIFRLQ